MKKILGLLTSLTIAGNGMLTVMATNSKNLVRIESINKTELNESNFINKPISNEPISFVEKFYDYNQSNWNVSVVLAKEKLLDIIQLFIINNKTNFIKETKQIIRKIKKDSINLSAKAFDESAVAAFADLIFKNFIVICNLFANLGRNQQIRVILYIENSQWIKDNVNLFKIVGEKSQWEENDSPIDSYSVKRDKNIVDYADKLLMNEKFKNIRIKHQNYNTLFIFQNLLWKKIMNMLYKELGTDITKFEEWFIKEIKTNINNSNYFLNESIPSDEDLKKVADYLFQNINNYNMFLQGQKKEILINLNNEGKLNFSSYPEYEKNSFVEKFYNYDESNWSLSLVLSKEKLLDIVSILFSQNFNQDDFIKKTKQIIKKVKAHNIIWSGDIFDESAIDAFAHVFFKNLSDYYNMFLKLEHNQLFMINLYITGGQYIKDKEIAKIIGTSNDLNTEEIKDYQLLPNLINKKIGQYSKISGNVVEKSTSTKFKIKINKITWSVINIMYFLTKDKNIFIKKITRLFSNFPPSYNDSYKLNNEELKSFAYLIWDHFNDYFAWFQKLKMDESIRITSFTNNPEGYWYASNPSLYNHIVNKNNEIIDWGIFNDRKSNNDEDDIIYHNEFRDEVRRKREGGKSLSHQQSKLYNVPGNGSCLFWSVMMALLLPIRNNNEAFRARFIQLFGENYLNYLPQMQDLFINFKLENNGNTHVLYNNRIAIFLVETVLRNNVVNYITTNLDRFRGENRATFSSAIVSEQRASGLQDLSDEQLISYYLNNMRLRSTWAGSIEIEAMANLLNTNITRNNEIFYPENQNQREINDIYIYHVNQNHYNFVLTNPDENQMDIDDVEEPSSGLPGMTNDITNVYLGQIPNNDAETIIDRISKANPRFDISKVYITDIHDNSATVMPFVPPLWKGKNPVRVRFSLPKKKTNQLQPTIQYPNVRQDDWKTKEIDLKKTTMPNPIKTQIHSSFCTLAVLENILANNLEANPNITLDQKQLFNHFIEHYKMANIAKNGMEIYAIYKFLKENDEIKNGLAANYSYFDFHNFFFHNIFNDKKLRMALFQMLVWASLYFSTPVILGTFNKGNSGHCVSLTGIRPNEDPLKTVYLIRDPNVLQHNLRVGQEITITGNDLYSSLFNNNGVFGALIISTYIFGSIFIPVFINIMRDSMPFFQSALGTMDRVPSPLVSEDSINTENDILESNCLFDNELLSIFYSNFL